MITFLVGLVILIVGGAAYGAFCEKIVRPTDAQTPALRLRDGVDFVPISKWKATLIELLNIAGTGPVLGPIQGILFGPIAFITIPVGCVLGGALHDYMSGMVSMRNDGEQMPHLIKKFLGNGIYPVYNVFICLLMLLVGAVFIYTPGDLFVAQILGGDASSLNSTVVMVYGGIFVYYLVATLFPIDKIIGKVYPIFGAILLLSAVGIFLGLFINGYPLSARTLTSEKQGRFVFYNAMIAEGFIAMCWAAGTMGVMNLGIVDAATVQKSAAVVVGIVAKDLLGNIGGMVAVLGVIILAITSGDTALRSLRMMIGDSLKIDQRKQKNIFTLATIIFAVVAGVLFFAKTDAQGFAILWRYFAWANETIAVFAFAMISVYMIKNKMPYFMALIPGTFYMYIISSYILHAKIGFNLPWMASYVGALILCCGYVYGVRSFKK